MGAGAAKSPRPSPSQEREPTEEEKKPKKKEPIPTGNEFTDASEWNLLDPSKFNRENIMEIAPDMTQEEFQTKFHDMLSENPSPLLFLRSFVRFYYWDLQNGKAGIVSPAFGDLHCDNFGYIEMTPKPCYVFTELADGGFAPVGLDALRYFVLLQLSYPDIDPSDTLIDLYFDIVNGKVDPPQYSDLVAKQMYGKLEIHQKVLEQFKRGENLVEDAEMKEKIQSFFTEDTRVSKTCALVNAMKVEKSVGTARYWAYIEVQDWEFHHDVVELKEIPKIPGTSIEKWPSISLENRGEWLMHTLWPSGFKPHMQLQATIDNKSFWIRSLTSGKGAFLDNKPNLIGLGVQVGIIAQKHQPAWAGSDRRDWLKRNRDFLVERYTTIFKTLQEHDNTPQIVA